MNGRQNRTGETESFRFYFTQRSIWIFRFLFCVLRLLKCFDQRKFNSHIEMLVEQPAPGRDTATEIRAHTRARGEKKTGKLYSRRAKKKFHRIDECTTQRHSSSDGRTRAEKSECGETKVGKSTRQRKNSNEKANDNGESFDECEMKRSLFV